MTNEELLRVIEQAAREKVTALDLSHEGLTVLPPEIGQLTSLTQLNLSGNKLTALPPQIGQLNNLTTLVLWNKRLNALPPEIGQLTNLTWLVLGDNNRGQFDVIHETIPGLKVATKVPLLNHPEIVVDYNYLLKLERKGIADFIPEGPEVEAVSVRQLLDGVNEPKREQRIILHEMLVTRFDDEELRDLCFKLNVYDESLPGGGKSGKARELVMFLERQGRLAELVTLGKKLRPEISWTEW